MGVRSYIKNTVKANTNVKGWAGWDVVKDNASIVKSFAEGLKPPAENVKPVQMTFEEAMKKYALTEAYIAKQIRTYFLTAWGCFAFSLAAFLWTFHLLFMKGMFLSSLVSLSLSALMAAYGFREHFHYFQLKKRKLDCTVSEWFAYFVRG